MTAAILALAAQLADAATYIPALARNPYGESNPVAAGTSLGTMLTAKLAAIVVMLGVLAVLWACSRSHGKRRLYRGGVGIVGLVGLVGAATNVIGGGLV